MSSFSRTPVLSVTSPASDLTLLTIAELRSAVGLTNNSRDADLIRIGTRIADALTQACHVSADGATPPTLRLETLTDTFRLNQWWGRLRHQTDRETLVLSRRPIVSIISVVEIGVTLDPTSDFEVRSAAGELTRLFNDEPSRWGPGKIVVSYTAGWSIVPEGLKRAAEKLTRFYWAEASRDPLLRSEIVTGLGEKTYWIGAPDDPSIPQDVMDDLGPYLNLLV